MRCGRKGRRWRSVDDGCVGDEGGRGRSVIVVLVVMVVHLGR